MPSSPQRVTTPAGSDGMPFASYAQIVRMLVPAAHKISFYDVTGRALWISDGIEEPEFRMHLELVLARSAVNRLSEPPPDADPEADPVYVLPIRNAAKALLGAVGIVCRNLPLSAKYRRYDAVEHLLAPLIEVIGFGWPAKAESPPAPVREAPAVVRPLPIQPEQQPTPLPALLRRTLALATRSLDCDFGAMVLPDRRFTLSHRISPDESDLAINAAIDNVREHILKWMSVRSEPLIINSSKPGHARMSPYKILSLPLRLEADRLSGLIMLFRSGHGPDFVSKDADSLAWIAAQIPADALSGVAPKSPAAAVAKPAAKPATPKVVVAPGAMKAPAPPSKPTVAPAPAPAPRPAAPSSTPRVVANPIASRPAPASVVPARPVELSMDARVRAALRDSSFDLYVQKISPLRDTDRSPRFEVLLRMPDADKLRTPRSFFAAAEAGMLMPELDRWVVRQLLATLRKHAVRVRTSCLEFSVNIAAQSLTADRFSEFLVAEVCKSAIPPGLLVFEVSESNALEHQHALEVMAARLRDVGCRIALDNCRVGIGSLGPMRRWPVSCVKIDGSLIRNVLSSSRSESQVRTVVQLAADRGIETVAECVESESVHNKLLDIGIDYAQGFHFGQPQPLQLLFR